MAVVSDLVGLQQMIPEVIKLFFMLNLCLNMQFLVSRHLLWPLCQTWSDYNKWPLGYKTFLCSTYAGICSFSSLAIFCGCCVRPGPITTNGPEVIKLFFMLNLCLNMQSLVSSHLLWLLCQTWSDNNKWPRG